MSAAQILSWFQRLRAGATGFAPVLLAEMDDKSQLACMTLAARHRPGAVPASAGLNTLAVMLPEWQRIPAAVQDSAGSDFLQVPPIDLYGGVYQFFVNTQRLPDSVRFDGLAHHQ